MQTPYFERLALVAGVLAEFITYEIIHDDIDEQEIDLNGWFEDIKPHLQESLLEKWGEDEIQFSSENY